MGSLKTFNYLNQSNCHELNGINDAHEYLATRRAMDTDLVSKNRTPFCNFRRCVFFMNVQSDFSSLYNSFQEARFNVIDAILHLDILCFSSSLILLGLKLYHFCCFFSCPFCLIVKKICWIF